MTSLRKQKETSAEYIAVDRGSSRMELQSRNPSVNQQQKAGDVGEARKQVSTTTCERLSQNSNYTHWIIR